MMMNLTDKNTAAIVQAICTSIHALSKSRQRWLVLTGGYVVLKVARGRCALAFGRAHDGQKMPVAAFRI